MLDTNFKLSWETFKNNLGDGFSRLQQMQEFVDVTLAAGGHYVKAHQNILAVASPYLKEMLKSIPCQHPVIFLGPISHTVLCFILEYIYSGEVNVPGSVLPTFIEAAKLLHIAGIKDIQLPQINPQVNANETSEVVNNISEEISSNNLGDNTGDRPESELEVTRLVNHGENIHTDNGKSTVDPEESLTDQPLDNYEKCDMDLDFENLIKIKKIERCPDIDTETSQDEQPTNFNTEDPAKCDMDLDFENLIRIEKIPRCSDIDTETSQDEQPTNSNTEDPAENVVVSDCSGINNKMDLPSTRSNNDVSGISKEANKNQDITTTPLYTRSNRGSLQMVMNRFIYYLHHTSFAKQKRRWRCINYRKNRCMAYVDTNGEIIISRKNLHSHPFQDKEIFKLGGKKHFFTSISEATDGNRQHISKNLNGKIADNKSEEQKKYEIKFEFKSLPIT